MTGILAVQYLEPSQEVLHLSTRGVVDRLRRAADRLPITHLLIGWRLPKPIVEACRSQAERLGIRFLRWHPLLAGSAALRQAPADWRVIGPSGKRVPASRNLSSFRFVCPNHPGVQEALLKEIETLAAEGVYQGFFLDRMRFPSPARDPFRYLACFCDHCRAKASAAGLDLEEVRRTLAGRLARADTTGALALELLGQPPTPGGPVLGNFLDFRCRSITDLVSAVVAKLRGAALEVGLDCFSPSLACMVGQDTALLSPHAGWIKIMTYAHALGPAGLPFELGHVYDFLRVTTDWEDAQILRRMSEGLQTTLPKTRQAFDRDGLPPLALRHEVEMGVGQSAVPVLAGLELVDIPGVADLNDMQIKADLKSIKAACPGGLGLSWDLLHIPLRRLDLVREVYVGK